MKYSPDIALQILLAGITSGPKDANPDECERFLCPLINELFRLWKESVVIVTLKYPQRRLVRVALVALVCDKPIAHCTQAWRFGSHRARCVESLKISSRFRSVPREWCVRSASWRETLDWLHNLFLGASLCPAHLLLFTRHL
ncbi:hypothetical protein C8R43DRAFT_893175 [Mycena crocata]|nr:hypothetical protein C8R43DRAFT_893175 [Mycena crocata]